MTPEKHSIESIVVMANECPTVAIPNAPGVYAIVSRATGRVYFGNTNSMRRRLSGHASRLRSGTHEKPEMQAEWDTHGESSFTFMPVVVAPKQAASEIEKELIEANQGSRCFNGLPGGQPVDEQLRRVRLNIRLPRWIVEQASSLGNFGRLIEESLITEYGLTAPLIKAFKLKSPAQRMRKEGKK